MMLTVLAGLALPLAAVVIASVGAALLAPLRISPKRTVLQSQWSTRQTPICSSPSRSSMA
jgi:hypothetical protein